MPNFILTYRSAKNYDALTDPDSFADWGTFLSEVIAPNVVDPGFPVFEPSTIVGEAGPSTQLGGYSVIAADTLEAALVIAEQCPTMRHGGGVEVGTLASLPSEHPAEQIRAELAHS